MCVCAGSSGNKTAGDGSWALLDSEMGLGKPTGSVLHG